MTIHNGHCTIAPSLSGDNSQFQKEKELEKYAWKTAKDIGMFPTHRKTTDYRLKDYRLQLHW